MHESDVPENQHKRSARVSCFGLLDDGIDSSRPGVYGPGFVGSEFKMVYHGRSEYGLTGDNVLYLAVNDSMDNDNSLSFTARISDDGGHRQDRRSWRWS